jgi:hypothetical protein
MYGIAMILPRRNPVIRRIRVALLGVCGLILCVSVNAAALNSPSQAAVDAAIAASYIRFNRNISGGAHTDRAFSGGASITLAVASHAGNTSADSRLLGQIRHTLTPGNEPTSNGGYPAQHEKHVTGMFVIVKNTPRIWDQLSASEKAKIDLIMKATLIASAFTTGDNNPYIKSGGQQYALDGDSNLHRDWNPNYREGMIGGVLVGMAYLGGPDAADSFLGNYNHSQFLSQLSANNLPNIHETFNWKAANPSSNAPSGSTIENAVRTYRYYGNALSNHPRIYQSLLNDTYGAHVNAGLNGGAGINGAGKIASGAATLPNPGAPGMLKEFDSVDGNGPRSSLHYAYDGYRPHLTNQLSLIVAGLWAKGSAIANDAAVRMNIGNTDLWYKAERGYIGYAKGKSQGLMDYPTSGATYGFIYHRAMWEDVLKPFHEDTGGDPPPTGSAAGSRISSAASARVHAAASATSALVGFLPEGSLGTILDGPEEAGGITWWQAIFDNGVLGWIGGGDFTNAPASESITTSAGGAWKNLPVTSQDANFIVSFNMTAGAAGIDGVTGMSAGPASTYGDLAVAVRFAGDGRIDARNGNAYQAEQALIYQPGVVYRVRLAVNLSSHSYSVVVTPAGGAPVTIASNHAFRSEQASVGSLANFGASATHGPHTVSGIAFGSSTPPSAPTGLHTVEE